MRYLKNIKTGKVTQVSDDDDQKFYALVGERDEDNLPVYVQTGAHDPAVKVEVKNEATAKLEEESGAELVTPNHEAPKAAPAKAEASS